MLFLEEFKFHVASLISELFTYLGLIVTTWLELCLVTWWQQILFSYTKRINFPLAYLDILRSRSCKLVHWGIGMTHHKGSYKMKWINRKPRQICIFLNGICGWEVSHVCLLACSLDRLVHTQRLLQTNTGIGLENRHKYNLQNSWLHAMQVVLQLRVLWW